MRGEDTDVASRHDASDILAKAKNKNPLRETARLNHRLEQRPLGPVSRHHQKYAVMPLKQRQQGIEQFPVPLAAFQNGHITDKDRSRRCPTDRSDVAGRLRASEAFDIHTASDDKMIGFRAYGMCKAQIAHSFAHIDKGMGSQCRKSFEHQVEHPLRKRFIRKGKDVNPMHYLGTRQSKRSEPSENAGFACMRVNDVRAHPEKEARKAYQRRQIFQRRYFADK